MHTTHTVNRRTSLSLSLSLYVCVCVCVCVDIYSHRRLEIVEYHESFSEPIGEKKCHFFFPTSSKHGYGHTHTHIHTP